MTKILLEGVLFIALIAITVALLFYVLINFTSVGSWLRQVENRRRIERGADQACPVHGYHEEQDLVRLTSGESICPECFKEAVHGKID